MYFQSSLSSLVFICIFVFFCVSHSLTKYHMAQKQQKMTFEIYDKNIFKDAILRASGPLPISAIVDDPELLNRYTEAFQLQEQESVPHEIIRNILVPFIHEQMRVVSMRSDFKNPDKINGVMLTCTRDGQVIRVNRWKQNHPPPCLEHMWEIVVAHKGMQEFYTELPYGGEADISDIATQHYCRAEIERRFWILVFVRFYKLNFGKCKLFPWIL